MSPVALLGLCLPGIGSQAGGPGLVGRVQWDTADAEEVGAPTPQAPREHRSQERP